MNKEIVNSVLAKLDALAAKLGMTVEQIWPWLVRQQYVDAVYSLILFVFFLLIGCISYRFVRKIDWNEWDINIRGEQIFGIVGGIISFIGIIVSFILFLSEFPDIFNAEYWALKDLFRMIR